MILNKKTQFIFSFMAIFVIILVANPTVFAAGIKKFRLLTTETDPNSVEVLKAFIAEYEVDNPDVKVEPEFLSWNDMFPRLIAAIAAKNPPEIVGLEPVIGATFVKRGLLIPVTDVINDLGRDDFFPKALELIQLGTKDEWMVPYGLGEMAMNYRADLYAKKGLKPPVTWDDYLKNCEALTEDTNGDGRIDIYGANLPVGTSRFTMVVFWSEIWGNGAHIFDKDDYIVMDKSPNLERIAETLEYWKKLAKYAPPGIGEYTWFEIMQSYYTGKTAHAMFAGRIMTQINRFAPELVKKTKATPLPHGPHGTHGSYLDGDGWTIMKGTRYPEEAKKFIKFMVTGDRHIRWLHTVPGHLMPARKSFANSKEFLAHPLLQANMQVYETNVEILQKYGTMFQTDGGGMHYRATEVLDSPVMKSMIQSVILKGVDPKEAIRKAADKFREMGVGK